MHVDKLRISGIDEARAIPARHEGNATMANRKNQTNVSATIDTFGYLCAQIAELESQKKAVRACLIAACGDGAHEGDLYRVTISTADRDTLDMEAVRAKLSRQFIAANTRTTEVTTVKATARNALNLASWVNDQHAKIHAGT